MSYPTIYLLEPLSKIAKSWIKEHVDKNALTFAKSVVVEHRYIRDIVEGMTRDGLVIDKDFLVWH